MARTEILNVHSAEIMVVRMTLEARSRVQSSWCAKARRSEVAWTASAQGTGHHRKGVLQAHRERKKEAQARVLGEEPPEDTSLVLAPTLSCTETQCRDIDTDTGVEGFQTLSDAVNAFRRCPTR